jgi:parallel beta-helix repeat protein
MSSAAVMSFAQVIDALRRKHGWQLADQIGQGGFAQVYKELIEGVPRAVKIPFAPLDIAEEHKQRELQALDVARRVAGHPRLVGLIHYELLGGYLVTVWEWADGGSLADLLQRYRQDGQQGIPLKDLLRYMLEAAEGIDYLNQKQGVYHRDIKPENLLLFHGHVKLADLGLAKIAGASTASHTRAGTWGYSPPEALEGQLHHGCDLYALAASYVRLRTGQLPFGEQPAEAIERQKRCEPSLEGITAAERPLVLQALAADPDKRFPDGAVAWVRAVDQALKVPTSKEATSRPQGLLQQPVSHDEQGVWLLQRVGQAEAGDKIVLDPGLYLIPQPLSVGKPLEIVGRQGPEETFIHYAGPGPGITYTGGGRLTLKGVCVERIGGSGGLFQASTGSINIENCRFFGAADAPAILVGGTIRGTISRCHIARNKADGIELNTHASVDLEENICECNGRSGIAYYGFSGGTARKNICRENKHQGICVAEQATPTVEENSCDRNEYSGMSYFGSAGGTARNNTCRENNKNGVSIRDQARPTIEENLCERNQWCGIAYYGASGGTARNNTCRENKCHGIYVQEQAVPWLTHNICERNDWCGIGYSGSSRGTAHNNICRENRNHGIGVTGQASPTLERNRCERNDLCGIAYFGASGGLARKNTCAGNKLFGIHLADRAAPTLKQNYRTGAVDGAIKGATFGAILGAISGGVVGGMAGIVAGAQGAGIGTAILFGILGSISCSIFSAIGGAILWGIGGAVAGAIGGEIGKVVGFAVVGGIAGGISSGIPGAVFGAIVFGGARAIVSATVAGVGLAKTAAQQKKK